MKIILFSGSHPRHSFLLSGVLETGHECAVVVMRRETLLPEPPNGVNPRDKKNFVRHFNDRYASEAAAFGELPVETTYRDFQTIYCTPTDLNAPLVANFVKGFDADLGIVFGTDLIRDPLLSILPIDTINIHLGLSPWYKGSATLFWPFYFLEPNYAGVTFHRVVKGVDSGGVIHQTLPTLERGDGIHNVGVKAVIAAREHLRKIILRFNRMREFDYTEQSSVGKLFLISDFKPEHLRLIYDEFENRIVDAYLDGTLHCKRNRKIIEIPDLI